MSKHVTPTTYKGVFYFPTFVDAREFIFRWIPRDLQPKETRIIPYSKGWAIQREVSGPYWGPKGWS